MIKNRVATALQIIQRSTGQGRLYRLRALKIPTEERMRSGPKKVQSSRANSV